MPEQIPILLADTCCLFKIGFSEAFRKPEKYLFDKAISIEEAEALLAMKSYAAIVFDWELPFDDYFVLRNKVLSIQPEIKLVTYFKTMTLQIFHFLQKKLIDGFFERDLNKSRIELVINESIKGNYLNGKHFKEFIPKIIAEAKLKNKSLEAFYYLISGYETKEIVELIHITEHAYYKRNTRLLKRFKETSIEHLKSVAFEKGLVAPCELRRKASKKS